MKQLPKDLDFCVQLTLGYLELPFNREFPNIILSDSGKMRLGSIVGAITGVYLSGDINRASEMATSFMNTMRCFPNHEVDVNDNGCNFKTPSTIVQLVDDGSPFGFGVGWYAYVPKENYHNDLSSDEKNRCIEHGLWKQKYRFYMNGGCIFHGWKRWSDQWPMILRDDLTDAWGLHT